MQVVTLWARHSAILLNENFPTAHAYRFLLTSVSPCLSRWHMVESRAVSRGREALPAPAHWPLWDGPHGCRCCSLQGSDETSHTGTGSPCSDFFPLTRYCRLSYDSERRF
jgi:hypothetical protein